MPRGKSRSRRNHHESKRARLIKFGLLGLAAVAAIALTAVALTPRGYSGTYAAPAPVSSTMAPAAPAMLSIARGPNPLSVLFVGDSLTSGFFTSTKATSFEQIMVAQLAPANPTTASIAKQTLATVSAVTAVPAGVDLAVVELGTNDVGVPTPLRTFSQEYSGLLAKITAASPHAAILCAGTWSDKGEAYDGIISGACAKAGGRYVSLSSLYNNASFHGPANVATWRGNSDLFHPNDLGHKEIARELLAAIAVK